MSKLIYPYPTLGDQLDLIIDSDIKIGGDGEEFTLDEALIDRETRSIDLTDEENRSMEYLSLPVKVQVSKSVFGKVGGETSLVVAAECSSTRLRQAIVLSASALDAAMWNGHFNLDLINYSSAISIHAVLTGPRLGLEHRFLGKSDDWTVHLDERTLPDVRGALPVKWTDFATDEERKYLRPYSSEPYYADLSEDPPLVLLNSGFEGLPELFPDQGSPARNLRALHETTRMSIARNIWLGLFQAALAGIMSGEPDEQAQWPERRWQEDILRQILPRVYEETDVDEALRLAAEDRSVAERAAWLESRAMAVIGKDILNEGKTWRTVIQDLSRGGI